MAYGPCPAAWSSFFLPPYPLASPDTWLGLGLVKLSPGVTVATTVPRGDGGVCAVKEGVISNHPTWDLVAVDCRTKPSPSHHPWLGRLTEKSGGKNWIPSNLQTWAWGCPERNLILGALTEVLCAE